jgi:hypothetical protein
LQVVFYIPPVQRTFASRRRFERVTAATREKVLELAEELDVPVVTAPAVADDDFRDPYHLRDKAAIDRVTGHVAAQIGEKLGKSS